MIVQIVTTMFVMLTNVELLAYGSDHKITFVASPSTSTDYSVSTNTGSTSFYTFVTSSVHTSTIWNSSFLTSSTDPNIHSSKSDSTTSFASTEWLTESPNEPIDKNDTSEITEIMNETTETSDTSEFTTETTTNTSDSENPTTEITAKTSNTNVPTTKTTTAYTTVKTSDTRETTTEITTETTTNTSDTGDPTTEAYTTVETSDTIEPTTEITTETSVTSEPTTETTTNTSDTGDHTTEAYTTVETSDTREPTTEITTVTTTDYCECESVEFMLSDVKASSSSFVVPFNVTAPNPPCTPLNIYIDYLNVTLSGGPFDSEEVQYCTAPYTIISLQQKMWITYEFYSYQCEIDIHPCSNYTLSMKPQYLTSCLGSPVAQTTSVLTLPGSEEIPRNVAVKEFGSDWVVISWDDSVFCKSSLTAYIIAFESLNRSGNKTKNTIRIPIECTNRTIGSTVYDSRTNCSQVLLDPCTRYLVTVKVEVFSTYISLPSNSTTFNTTPPENLYVQIDGPVESGSDWLVVRWNLSIPQCQAVTSDFQLNFTNIWEGSNEILDCNINATETVHGSTFVFNTSSKDCGNNLTLVPCSEYQFVIVPEIFHVLYSDYSGTTNGTTDPTDDTTANILSTDFGSEWISFNWTSSVQECKKAITGFWLSITATDALLEDDSFQYISMEDCYSKLEENQEILFNTSSPCPENSNSSSDLYWDITQCSRYRVKVIPEFFLSFNGSENSIENNTIPGDDIAPVTENIEAGKSWISFEWTVSAEKCRKFITGLWVSKIPYSLSVDGGESAQICQANTTSQEFTIFNTSLPCFGESLYPCSDYAFKVTLDFNGEQVGQDNIVQKWTVPGDDATALVYGNQSGVNWMSFHWQSSVPECQKFVTGYRLNVSDFLTGNSQERYLPRTCSEKSLYEIVFNSSLPCATLQISPCTSYLVTLLPEYFIENDTLITGVEEVIHIGTKSGEFGEIIQPMIASQGTNSLTLAWREPTCRSTANLLYYNVSVMPDWNIGPKDFKNVEEAYLIIKPKCLNKQPNETVFVTLKDVMCDHQGYKFISCAPYTVEVLPVYELPSANQDLFGWKNGTNTLPLQSEASVTNLSVQDIGTQWISISWPIPACRIPVSEWNLTVANLSSSDFVILPPDCPTFVNSSHYTLNVSNSIKCRGNNFLNGFSIIPCASFRITLNVKYLNLDLETGSDNTIAADTKLEPPGEVSNINYSLFKWDGTAQSVLLEWDAPNKNAQCVTSYLIEWKDQHTNTTETHAILDGLLPCSTFSVKVNSLPDSTQSSKLSIPVVIVSTDSIEPAPVDSRINVYVVDQYTRNLSWLKPQVDYCISGYEINITDTKSADVLYNHTVKGKDTTWLVLNEEFYQEETYVISMSSYCDFQNKTSSSSATTHAFKWDAAGDMIDVASVVCGIIFPILIVAIICVTLQLRKSQGNELTPIVILENTDKSELETKAPRILNGRKPIPIDELSDVLDELEADSSYMMSKEFEEIIKLSLDWAASYSYNVAKLSENRSKNHDHTRVKLQILPDASACSDYINASFISGFMGEKVYIATQGPKTSTIEDFWLMCYEQNVKVIIMLTSLEERGRTKCAQYWPSANTIQYGSIQIELTNEVEESYYTIRDFLITRRSSSPADFPKFARQMHYTQWPDFGCPKNPQELINFILAMRAESNSLYNTYRVNSSIVVHCSAGVGRTGTLIALDNLMEQARLKKVVDVVRTVLKIRKERARMVQTEEQYHFLYKCINSYIRNELRSERRERPLSLNNSNNFYQSSNSIALTPLSFFQKNSVSV